jgi:repressor LexA
MNTLTVRQRAVLDAIRASVTDRGYPPSMQEVAETVGLASTGSVAYQLEELQRKGFIARVPRQPRAISILDPSEVSNEAR